MARQSEDGEGTNDDGGETDRARRPRGPAGDEHADTRDGRGIATRRVDAEAALAVADAETNAAAREEAEEHGVLHGQCELKNYLEKSTFDCVLQGRRLSKQAIDECWLAGANDKAEPPLTGDRVPH